jgi:hypothetical protein
MANLIKYELLLMDISALRKYFHSMMVRLDKKKVNPGAQTVDLYP